MYAEGTPDIKFVLLGRHNAGKTALLNRFLNNRFDPNYNATIGTAFISKTMRLPNGRDTVIGIWDTAGSERYRSITRMYYRGAAVALICFDLTDPESFQETQFWMDEMRTSEPNCLIALCGTKKDLLVGLQRCVRPQELESFGYSLSASIYETSSKTSEGIFEMFQDLVNQLFETNKIGVQSGLSLASSSGRRGQQERRVVSVNGAANSRNAAQSRSTAKHSNSSSKSKCC